MQFARRQLSLKHLAINSLDPILTFSRKIGGGLTCSLTLLGPEEVDFITFVFPCQRNFIEIQRLPNFFMLTFYYFDMLG